jgi:Na+/H+-dicarboxylate symporter
MPDSNVLYYFVTEEREAIVIKKFLNLPFFVMLLFILALSFGESINADTKSHMYAISLFLKDLIVFVLPILIFSFVVSGIINLKKESVKAISILVPLVCISNFSGFWVSYIFATPFLKSGIVTISKLDHQNTLMPAWEYHIVPLIKNDIALILGVIFGFIGSFSKLSHFISKASKGLYVFSNVILKKVICPVLPIFIFGFIIKMQHEGSLLLVIKEYSVLLSIVAILTYGYMFSIMFFLSGRNLKNSIAKFKNLLPGVLIGLFSMSSAAAIPNTIEGSEKNLDDPNIARFVIPATANMHLLGDCFAIPIIGLALIVSFGYTFPSPSAYLVFSLYGIIAKFASAGIPGGSALIFVPIFESVFGFSAQMLTALTAVYILFDPIATSSNVFGHGMFAMLFEKVYNNIFRKKSNSR